MSCDIVVLQPHTCRNMGGLGYSPFARHYQGNHYYFLFLQVLRCFSSLRQLPSKMDDIPSECRVVPFGNLWIKGYLHLPRAYRSLSRPSSPPRAKASAMRPCLLSFKLTFKYQVSSIRYYPGILNIAVLKTYGSIYTFSSLLNFTFCTSCQRSFLFFRDGGE